MSRPPAWSPPAGSAILPPPVRTSPPPHQGGSRVPLRPTRLAAAVLALALSTAGASAATFDFYDRGPYREGVPRPAEILGYEPGTFHTSFGNMERYIDALVRAAPERVVRESIGRSYEFRERALLVIASPAHLRRLDAIREASGRLADPRKLASEAEAEKLV